MHNDKPAKTQDFSCKDTSIESDSMPSPDSHDSYQPTPLNNRRDTQNRIDMISNLYEADIANSQTGADPRMAGSFIKHLT